MMNTAEIVIIRVRLMELDFRIKTGHLEHPGYFPVTFW